MLLSLLPVLSLAALAIAHPHHGGLRRHASHQARALRERPIQMNEGLHLAKPEDKALERRSFDGMRATYYDAGLGACGLVNTGADFIVALNTPQFGSGYPGPNCFKSITIQYNGITAQATVTDQCPGCPYGGLDLTQSLMEHFVGVGNALNVGVISINWWFNDEAPAPAPTTSTYVAPAPETTWQAPTSEYVPPASSAWVDPSPWTSQQQQQATQAAPSPESSWAPAPAPSSSAWVDPSPWTSQQQASSSAAAPPSQAPASSSSSDQASVAVSVSGSSQYSSMGSFNASVAASASAGSVSNAGSSSASSASSSSSSSSSAGSASNASSSASGNASTVATVPGSGSNLADLNALIVQLGGSAATIIAQSS